MVNQKKKKKKKEQKIHTCMANPMAPTYRCLPCRGSGAYARSNIDLVN